MTARLRDNRIKALIYIVIFVLLMFRALWAGQINDKQPGPGDGGKEGMKTWTDARR